MIQEDPTKRPSVSDVEAALIQYRSVINDIINERLAIINSSLDLKADSTQYDFVVTIGAANLNEEQLKKLK